MTTRRTSQTEMMPQIGLMAVGSGRRLSAILPTHPPIEVTMHSQAKRTSLSVISNPDEDDGVTPHLPFSPEKAAYALIFAVFAHGINFSCILPNIPLMCMPGMHEDNFPSIDPWMGFASAQYFILAAVAVGTVSSGFFYGWLAGKIGYRITFMILALGSVVFTMARYFGRGSYWGFATLTFVNSSFGGTVVVGNGYVSNIFNDRFKIDSYIGYLLASLLLSSSLGGLLTVIFPQNLFLPLIPAAAISFTAFVVVYFFVLEPASDNTDPQESVQESDNEDASQTLDAPGKLNKLVFANIVIGSFLDNVGSLGIYPLAFSPVMYEKFFLDFEMQSLTPVMSENQFRWLYSLVLLTVVPSTLVVPFLYKRLGIAVTCVIANVLTGVIILGLLFAAEQPATEGSFALFTSIVYLGVPLAVISNLTTGPMLDRVSPKDLKYFAQGLNSACYNLANAIFPVVFGIVSDMRGFMSMLYILVGVQALASLVNLPLIFSPLLRRESAQKGNEDVVQGSGKTDGTESTGAKEEKLVNSVDKDKSDEEKVDVEEGTGLEGTGHSAGISQRASSVVSC